MFVDRLFPSSDLEQERAIKTPSSFWVSEFFRGAAGFALIQTVSLVLWPSPTFESPGVRLYSAAAFGFFMATAKLLVARRVRSTIAPSNTR